MILDAPIVVDIVFFIEVLARINGYIMGLGLFVIISIAEDLNTLRICLYILPLLFEVFEHLHGL